MECARILESFRSRVDKFMGDNNRWHAVRNKELSYARQFAFGNLFNSLRSYALTFLRLSVNQRGLDSERKNTEQNGNECGRLLYLWPCAQLYLERVNSRTPKMKGWYLKITEENTTAHYPRLCLPVPAATLRGDAVDASHQRKIKVLSCRREWPLPSHWQMEVPREKENPPHIVLDVHCSKFRQQRVFWLCTLLVCLCCPSTEEVF